MTGKATNPKEDEALAKRRKPPLALIPPAVLIDTAEAMRHGALKYGRFSWRESGLVLSSVYMSAILRHVHAWADGESNDPDSGASHLGHVVACCAILADAMAHGVLVDDRVSGPFAAKISGES